jgi:pilus assembly protein CpaF
MELDLDITFGVIAPFMSDPTIEEIWINTPERIFIARNGRSELTNLLLSSDDVRNIVERALMWSGRRLDLSHPFVDARLPDGSRLHVVIPEITAHHWAVNIRKHIMRSSSLEDLVDRGVMSSEICTALTYCVQAGLNILVSGGTQAGKTTVLNALTGAIPRGERVVTIEEVFELSPQLPDVVQMQTRSANLQDLLIALNSGLPGMGTLHANSPRDAIIKLQTLPLLAGENISHKFIAPTVASAIDVIIHTTLDVQGKRRINEVAAVTGRYENDRAEIEMLWKWDGSQYQKGVGSLPNPDRFTAIGAPLSQWWHL